MCPVKVLTGNTFSEQVPHRHTKRRPLVDEVDDRQTEEKGLLERAAVSETPKEAEGSKWGEKKRCSQRQDYPADKGAGLAAKTG